jgi:hypothetical protein
MNCVNCNTEYSERVVGYDNCSRKYLYDPSNLCLKCFWKNEFETFIPSEISLHKQIMNSFSYSMILFLFLFVVEVIYFSISDKFAQDQLIIFFVFLFSFVLSWLIIFLYHLIFKEAQIKIEKKKHARLAVEQFEILKHKAINQRHSLLMEIDAIHQNALIENEKINTRIQALREAALRDRRQQEINEGKHKDNLKVSPINYLQNDNDQFELNDQSILMQLGYKITGLTDDQRWNILVNSVLPVVPLQNIVKIISGLIYNRRSMVNGEVRNHNSISKWTNDLNRLKKEYYRGGFRWPNY